MGGKGKRRRERNYKAAHGGFSRLPPPPNPSSVDALPSKLRQLISLTSGSGGKVAADVEKRKKRVADKKEHLNGDSQEDGEEVVDEKEDMLSQEDNGANKKLKTKRKRNQVTDLRFQEEVLGVGSKRRERKKKYLEERKKRLKKGKTGENLEFPGQEKVKFGDIVQAPPKLVKIPKAFKTGQDASKERLRLKAVEAYRQRKGWDSRPGVHLPPPVTTSQSD